MTGAEKYRGGQGEAPEDAAQRGRRRHQIFQHATEDGLMAGRKACRISGRVTAALFEAALEKSGLKTASELVEYALSKVAVEDDFGARLLARKGRIASDIEL